MFRNNKNLMVIALIAVVNALGYGIIIPILYTYSKRFGMSDFQNGLLFSMYSVFQFLSTPLIGRLSDIYGRKPLLILSILGTAGSFFLMAWAPGPAFLYLARALDGITAGNIPVASAVIADTTDMKDRAKGFGIIGAAFGFGFIFGPAISALTIGYSIETPFIIAGTVSVIAAVLTWIILPETNKHKGIVRKEKLIDFMHLLKALLDENVGMTLLISFIYAFAFSVFIYAYQPLSVKILHLSAAQISFNFTVIGLVGLVSQALIIPRITRRFGDKPMLRNALLLETVVLVGFYLTKSLPFLLFVSVFHSLSNAFINPLIQSLLSKEVDEHSQGSIQGINASFVSLGMIIGPVAGGILSTILIPLPFLLAAAAVCVCFFLSIHVMAKARNRQVSI